MHPILEAFLIVLAIGVIVFLLGAIVGLFWFTVQRDHEADRPNGEFPSGGELDIPADREFTEPKEADYLGADYVPITPSINGRASVPTSRNLSAFPHDTDYESLQPKRF